MKPLRRATARALGTLSARPVRRQATTAGLADASSDVASVWLPLPDAHLYEYLVLAEEPCVVAMPEQHARAESERVTFDALAAEPLLALPASTGPLRGFWLGNAHRRGRPATVGAEITSSDETYEALMAGLGCYLLAEGNAPSLTRGGITTRPVDGLPPSRLALAWRRDQASALRDAYVECARDLRRLRRPPGG